jgi:hypothetical protein
LLCMPTSAVIGEPWHNPASRTSYPVFHLGDLRSPCRRPVLLSPRQPSLMWKVAIRHDTWWGPLRLSCGADPDYRAARICQSL